MNKIHLLLLVILNVVVSFAIPFMIGRLTTLSDFQQWVMGGLIFVAINGMEILLATKQLLDIRTSERRAWTEKAGFTALLSSVRTDYQNMMNDTAEEDASLVRHLIWQRAQKLRDDVHTAAEAKELHVANNHAIDTRRVTDLFRTGKASVFREVFKILDDGSIFDTYTRSYCKEIHDLTSKGAIKSVKVLLVVEPHHQEALKKAGKLVQFCSSSSAYETRVISKADFDTLHLNSGLEQCEDFGIYGDILLFRTLSYDPTSGIYSYDSVKIRRYREFFDACWSQHQIIQLPSTAEDVGLDDVLKL